MRGSRTSITVCPVRLHRLLAAALLPILLLSAPSYSQEPQPTDNSESSIKRIEAVKDLQGRVIGVQALDENGVVIEHYLNSTAIDSGERPVLAAEPLPTFAGDYRSPAEKRAAEAYERAEAERLANEEQPVESIETQPSLEVRTIEQPTTNESVIQPQALPDVGYIIGYMTGWVIIAGLAYAAYRYIFIPVVRHLVNLWRES